MAASAEALLAARRGGRLASADDLLAAYEDAAPDERRAFLADLAWRFEPDRRRLDKAVEQYKAVGDGASLTELHAASEPKRQELIRQLNLAHDGTRRLVTMRADLQRMWRDIPNAEALDADFRHVFASWFNAGFLRLERLDWNSSASILRKVIRYEAVHEIGDWEELRRRIEPVDRRCYALFHTRMPDEPLIFVEVALTREVPGSIANLLRAERPVVPPTRASVATYYSICNCQEGLKGVPFGNVLITRVMDSLKEELPNVRRFVTLSPIPGLRAWAERQGAKNPGPEEVRRLAARYLTKIRNTAGLPDDPVARFHLGNGAKVFQVHPGANPSERGLRESFGAMVNYFYDPRLLDANQALVAAGKRIPASGIVAALASGNDRKTKPPVE